MASTPIAAIPASVRYVSFWARVLASIVDTVLIMLLMTPLGFLVFGHFQYDYSQRSHDLPHFVINTVVPAMAVILFWVRAQATPGKMLIHARIVDATTGGEASTGGLVLRYIGYFVSLIFFGLGFLWVAFDRRKQGWHDKIAGTVVIHHDDLDPGSSAR
jgi:uncharacterized RDD family membrane protein YckC